MSSPADKASPKAFMAFGLILCAVVNLGMGFSGAFWLFVGFVALNGLFQGMGVGPSLLLSPNGSRAVNAAVSGLSGISPTTSAAVSLRQSWVRLSRFSVPSTGRRQATRFRQLSP